MMAAKLLSSKAESAASIRAKLRALADAVSMASAHFEGLTGAAADVLVNLSRSQSALAIDKMLFQIDTVGGPPRCCTREVGTMGQPSASLCRSTLKSDVIHLRWAQQELFCYSLPLIRSCLPFHGAFRWL